MPTANVSAKQIEVFCRALKARLLDKKSGFGKGYLRLLVDEIRIEGDHAIMRGSYENLAYAVGCVKESSKEVPIFMREWRAREDSNL
jgi:site-specific DNA recombinase